MMRLLPIFPWDMVNYALGLCGLRFRDYFWGSLVGMLPWSFTYALVGSSLGQPLNKGWIITVFGLVAVIGLAAALKSFRSRRH